MRSGLPKHLWPQPIAETIRYWRTVGTSPQDVWESVTGRRPVGTPTWNAIAALLLKRLIAAEQKPKKTVAHEVDGISWREAA